MTTTHHECRQARLDLGRRLGLRIRQEDVAGQLKIPQTAVSQMESGLIGWSEDMLRRYMAALDAIEAREGVPSR